MTPQDIYLSVVVPAYNEAGRITKTLRRFHQYFAANSFSYEILVVLDGPTDGTRAVLKHLAGEIEHLRIIDRVENRGKGYTVKEGLLKASGQIRLFTDADDSTDIAHFGLMKPLFDQGYDLVIASRNPVDVAGAQQTISQAWYKRLVGRLGNGIVQIMAVRDIWDTQCGFKAFRAEVAERIFSQTMIDGWGFDIEVLAIAQAAKYRIGIIPARWINDDRSHVGLFDYLRVLGETVKVGYKLATGRYRR
jgi:glycosyltransferase involved in cell wall biosynthesis